MATSALSRSTLTKTTKPRLATPLTSPPVPRPAMQGLGNLERQQILQQHGTAIAEPVKVTVPQQLPHSVPKSPPVRTQPENKFAKPKLGTDKPAKNVEKEPAQAKKPTTDDEKTKKQAAAKTGDSEEKGEERKAAGPAAGKKGGGPGAAAPTVAKGAAKTGANVQGKEGTADADGGGADKAAAGEGGDDAAVALEPPPPPRFEGTQALHLTLPLLNAQQQQQVLTQTGMKLEEHYLRVQTQLDRLSARAEQEQRAIVFHIDVTIGDARRDLDASAARIPDYIGSAIGTVQAAYGGARASITKAADDALKTIEKSATEADKHVDQAALTSKEAVENAVLATSPKLQALYKETMDPLRKQLSETAQKLKETAKTKSTGIEKKGEELAKALLEEGGDALVQAQAESESKAVPDLAKEAGKDLVQAGEDGAADVLDQEPTLGMSFLLMVNPAAVKVEEIGGDDANTCSAKPKQVRLRLTNDYERSRAFVETTRDRAVKTLEAGEKSSVAQLRKLERRLQTMARQRRDALINAMQQGEAPAADAWAQQMARANQMVPQDQILDSRRLEGRLSEAMDSMNALSARQRGDFDAQTQSGLADTRRGLEEDRKSIDEAVDGSVAGTRETEQQVSAMRGIAGNFAAGFRGVAHPASSAAGDFRTKAEEKLGQPVKAVREGMTKMLTEVTDSMKTTVTKFDTGLQKQIDNLRTNLAPAFDQIQSQVIEGTPASLKERASKLYAAMDRIGTDESAVFEALHALTPKMGLALEEYWRPRHDHDLRWWLDDELSGDEYHAAIQYLNGDPSGGAKFELAASLHWYGDDTKQIETALRALSPEDLKKLTDKSNTDAQKVISDVQGSLKGTNLDVTNALLAGRVARADALRLKEQIDAARMSEDDDKLHDALSSVDPKQLPEVRRELADVLKGNPMSDKPPSMDDKDATKALTDYITRPVDIYDPNSDTTRTATLSEPSKTLAVALATKGEGSAEARAARLAFETSRDGKPRVDKLAKALDDPELIQARKNPLLKNPNDNPRAAARAQADLDRLEKQRSDMMLKFAELRGADEETKKDPRRAQEFTEKSVADMFGDDKLGRELGTSMVKDGKANPAVAIKYAVRGWGTNEELIRKTLRGMKPSEIKELKADYANRFGEGNANALYDDLGVFQNEDTAKAAGVEHATGGGFFTELSGDERQEVEELLLGEPQNDRDRWRLAKLKSEHQMGEGTTWVGRGVGLGDSEPARALKMDQARMEKMIADAGGPDKAFDEKGNFVNKPDAGLSRNEFRVHVAGVSGAAEDYKHHVDSIADMITGAIAIIGAIVGTIVVMVLTAGTATPLVIGLWAAGIAAATGAAAMAVNYSLKGSRYGWEQAAVDAAVTLVDAATAGLTAGAGAKAARAAAAAEKLATAARTPAQAAVAKQIAQRQAQKELVRGFVRAAAGAGVGGMARTSLADGTWDDGVLHGLSNVVGSGVKSAAIGVATHGAVSAFHGTDFAKGLSRSTSYLGRGLGAGLSGAVGGMAGRSAEIGIDALTGKSEGPWYDQLGSVLAAGGRGFVENVGEGLASVPKARRDAKQAEIDEKRAEADRQRVARYGPSADDYAADATFRRKAAAAAVMEDRRTDLKAFLADLDAGVTGDRAAQENHHKLMRQFRTEALAGIPPEQRGEFAKVPIHLLSDGEFERFTGSTSGQAVTIFVDGEPQIIARRSAAPEDLREEGIHLLQSRDPRWKDRIGRLDESNLARWRDLDLESQLSLYRDKLEIELDAQDRLRRNLLEEADTTKDPAQRAALRTRADEIAATEDALRARRTEVDALGPAERDAIRHGDADFPQYLREEPRLFKKKQKLSGALPEELDEKKLREHEGTELRHGSPDLGDKPRRPVALENTTWEEDYPGKRVFQVGDAWTEPEIQGKGRRRKAVDRWYRMVEVVDEAGNVLDRRREILQEGGRWQQRGSESSDWGRVFEQASRLRTLSGMSIDPDTDARVPIGALRKKGGDPNAALSAQHGGGAGFDDVVLEFRTVNGREEAHIIIVEAKGYRRALTLGDFTAITANVEDNLDALREAVAGSNLSPERIEAVRRAITRRDLSFDVHTSSTTKLGDIESGRASILKTIQQTEDARRQLAIVRGHLLDVDETTLTDQQRTQLESDIKRINALGDAIDDAYEREPFNPARVEEALRRTLRGTRRAESVGDIASRYVGLDLDADPLSGLPMEVRRTPIDEEGVDKRFVDAARAQLGMKKDLQRSAGFAIGVAEQMGVTDRTFRPVPTAPAAPSDVRVVQSADGRTSVAVTRPAVSATAPGVAAAAEQLVRLVHDGVATVGRTTKPDHVIWDAAQVAPDAVTAVVKQVRAAMAKNLDDLSKLHVLLPGSVAKDETTLRALLELPRGAKVEQIDRPPHDGTTWLVSFPPAGAK